MAEILYRVGNDLDFEQYMAVYVQSTLGERRPVGDRELMRRTQLEAPRAALILLSAPAAEKYYPHAGFTQHHSAWIKKPGD